MINQQNDFLIDTEKNKHLLTLEEKKQYIKFLKNISQDKSEKYQFTDQQINSILSDKNRGCSIYALLQYYPKLIEQPFNFDSTQLTSLVVSYGGFKKLKTIQKNNIKLRDGTFTAKQIFKMVSPDGGAKNIETVLDTRDFFKRKGFNTGQIVRMVSHNAGSKNIDTVLLNYHTLKNEMQFTREQIVRMVSHQIGSKNINSVLLNYHKLKNEMQFTREQIVRMVSYRNGSKNIKSVLLNYHELKNKKQFTREQITKMASYYDGSIRIETVREKNDELRNEGYNNEQILQTILPRYDAEDSIHESLDPNRLINSDLPVSPDGREFLVHQNMNTSFFDTTEHLSGEDSDLLNESLCVFVDCGDCSTRILNDASSLGVMQTSSQEKSIHPDSNKRKSSQVDLTTTRANKITRNSFLRNNTVDGTKTNLDETVKTDNTDELLAFSSCLDNSFF